MEMDGSRENAAFGVEGYKWPNTFYGLTSTYNRADLVQYIRAGAKQ